MGRKIKGRKHRGIRDPEKQREVKLASIKDKINRPPTNPDEQQIPKSLSHIINLKDKIKSGAITLKRKRKPKKKLGPVTSHPYGIKQNPSLPFFEQKPDECDRKFMWRVQRICRSVVSEAAFENKYGVDIKRNSDTGQVEGVVKRKKDELEMYMKQVRKEQKLKGKKKVKKDSDETKLTKSQKRDIKLKQKKENKLELNKDEFKKYEDKVKFGEVVHGPPNLSAPRRANLNETPRPGKKNLLLKSMIKSNEDSSQSDDTKTENKLKTNASTVIDKKGKRKDLPHALRRQLDKQQQEVIEAYKKLKSKRYNTG